MKNEKVLVLKLIDRYEDWNDFHSQELENKEENINFSVSDLSDCPEDACIGRDLFDADDYISVLEKGMELAKKGYTKINVEEIKEDE